MILKNCRYVVTQNEGREILEHQDIVLENGLIKEIRPTDDLSYENQLDCSRKLVMPGLINMHTHLGMTSLKGYSDDKELKSWLENDIWPKEAKFTEKDVENSSLLGLKEMIRTGTTSFVDMYFHTSSLKKSLKKIPLRSFVGYGMIDGTLEYNEEKNFVKWVDFNKAKEEFDQAKKNIALFSKNAVIAPHSPYTVSKELLIKSKKLATENDLYYVIHVNETRQEFYRIRKMYGKNPIEYLDEIGVLDGKTILVHNVWATKNELEIIKKRGSTVVFCATSNAKLASGSVFPYNETLKRGINITLGTDSSSSNNSLDMFQEMKFSSLLIKNHLWDPTVASAQEILDAATRNAGNALGLKLGKIEKNYLADLITLDLDDVSLIPNENNLISHLVYSVNSYAVKDVIVDGNLILKDGKLNI